VASLRRVPSLPAKGDDIIASRIEVEKVPDNQDYLRAERRAQRLRLITVLAVAIGGYLLVTYIFHQSKLEVQRILERQGAARYTLELETPRMRGYDTEGNMVWNIEAEAVTLDEDKNIVTFTDTTAEFYDKGEKALDVSVGTLIYNRDTRNMEMFHELKIHTSDNLTVDTTRVRWLDYYQKFIFPEGATLRSEEGNYVKSDYLQSNKALDQLEAVGHVTIYIAEFTDEELIKKHELTEEEVNLKEFKKITITAEKAIYDRKKQVVVGTSRLYDKPFRITSPDGKVIDVAKFQKEPAQVFFSKKELAVTANHIETHIKDKWVRGYGAIRGKIHPSEPRPGEDKPLQVMRKKTTWFSSEDVEYWWGKDYARTNSRTVVVQKDRLAAADSITYYGQYEEPGRPGRQKALFVEGHGKLWQKSGDWMFDEGLLEGVKQEKLQNTLKLETDIEGDRMVLFLNRNDLHAVGGVRAVQKERVVRADELLYFDREKKFIANGNVHFVDKDGQEFYGEQIIYFSDREDIEVNGAGTATIKIPKKYRGDIDRALARIKGEKTPESESEPEAGKESPPSGDKGQAVEVAK